MTRATKKLQQVTERIGDLLNMDTVGDLTHLTTWAPVDRPPAEWLVGFILELVDFQIAVAVVHRVVGSPDGLSVISQGKPDWPDQAVPSAVLEWCSQKKQHPNVDWAAKQLINWMASTAAAEETAPNLPFVQSVLALLAHLYLAEQAVNEARRRPFMAVDTGPPHKQLLDSWTGNLAPMVRVNTRLYAYPQQTKLFLLKPGGQPIQLSLPFEGATLSDAMVHSLRTALTAKGLRHWCALQALLSIEGGRMGSVLWSIDDQHRRLNYSAGKSRDPKVRADTLDIMRTFQTLELHVENRDGDWIKAPLLARRGDYGHRDKDELIVDGCIVEPHPLLYNGIRQKNGRLGTRFYPQAPELAHIDHKRYPYAHGLGLCLCNRWFLQWRERKSDHARFRADTLLSLAGITTGKIGHRVEKLHRNLDELQRRQCLGRYEIQGPKGVLSSVYLIYPTENQLDITLRSAPRIEKRVEVVPLTGRDLKTWRKRKGLTQRTLAQLIKIGERTIKRAEQADDKKLTSRLRNALSGAS